MGALPELVSAVLAGEVSERAGRDRADTPELAATVSADDVASLADALLDITTLRADDKPLSAMRVLRAAAWASGNVDASAITSIRLLGLLHTMLSRHHDGALLEQAVDEHRRALLMLAQRPTPAWCLAGVRSEFGRLVVDALTRAVPQGDRDALEARYRDLRAGTSTLAPPEELLRRAADDLAGSAAAYPGPVDGDRAAALKAQAEAVEALETLSVPPRPGEDPDAIRMRALAATPAEDVDVRAGLVLGLLAKGVEVPTTCGLPVSDAAGPVGVDRTAGALLDTAQAVGLTEPAGGLRILARARPLLGRCAPDLREAALEVELSLLRRLAPAGAEQLDPEGLRARADDAGWTDVQRVAAFVAGACRATDTNREPDGLAFLADARAVSRSFVDEHRAALKYLQAGLENGAGITEYRRGKWASAIRWYGQATRSLLDLDLPDRAEAVLGSLLDATRQAGEDDRLPILADLGPLVGRLEIRAGTRASLLLQEAFRTVSAAGGAANSEVLWALRCLAKGARLASALRVGATVVLSEDPVATSLLARVRELETAGQQEDPDGDAVLDDAALVAYAGHDELFAGDTAVEQVRNARRRFDTHVADQLLRPVTVWAGLGYLQARLDDRTVVLDWYQGATPDGRAALQLLVFSRDQVEGSVIPYDRGARPVAFDLDGRTVLAGALAPDTVLRRLAVRRFPLDEADLVVADAVRPVQDAMAALLGSLGADMLGRHRAAGRDHLCLVPHGSLHFEPVHLYGPVGRPPGRRLDRYQPAEQCPPRPASATSPRGGRGQRRDRMRLRGRCRARSAPGRPCRGGRRGPVLRCRPAPRRGGNAASGARRHAAGPVRPLGRARAAVPRGAGLPPLAPSPGRHLGRLAARVRDPRCRPHRRRPGDAERLRVGARAFRRRRQPRRPAGGALPRRRPHHRRHAVAGQLGRVEDLLHHSLRGPRRGIGAARRVQARAADDAGGVPQVRPVGAVRLPRRLALGLIGGTMRLQDLSGLAVQRAELVPLDPTRGGAEAPRSSVGLGGPITLPYGPLDEDDPQLSAFMEGDGTHVYHLVRLRCTFDADDREPFVEAVVRFRLSRMDGGSADQPVGWDAIPERATSAAGTRSTTTSFAAKATMLGVELGPSFGHSEEWEIEEAFAEIHGLLSSEPRWKLRRTTSHPLSGDQQLSLVVRAPGVPVVAGLEVTASIEHRRFGLVPYRVEVPAAASTTLLTPRPAADRSG